MRSFGDGQTCSGSDPSPLHFTGKPRDPETGLDDFGARLYSSSLGRWMSPDWSAAPEAVPYANLSDPQTLNLYAYAANNPVTRSDADGHTPIDDAWMQSGHMMQEVGFAFHLWDGQPEGEAKGGGCTTGGCTVNVVAPRPRDIALQFVRSWAWQAWRGIRQSFQHWWSTRGCQPGQLCTGMAAPSPGGALGEVAPEVGPAIEQEIVEAAGAIEAAEESGTAKGLARQLQEHVQKLGDYMRDPAAVDNKGFLRDATPDQRAKIVSGRIANLRGQIRNFTQQIRDLVSNGH